MAKVRDTMRTSLAVVGPGDTVMDLSQKMAASDIGIIPVREKGKLRGIVTERAVICCMAAGLRNLKKEQARALMRNDQPIVSPGDDLRRAARIMARDGVQVLPVAENGILLGLVTLNDLARESLALGAVVLAKAVGGDAAEVRA